ncbi:hypothetical protein GBAR_LOCUS16482, partial [Geodia barretti]
MHKKVVGTLILIRTTLFCCFLVFVLKPQRGGMCVAISTRCRVWKLDLRVIWQLRFLDFRVIVIFRRHGP